MPDRNDHHRRGRSSSRDRNSRRHSSRDRYAPYDSSRRPSHPERERSRDRTLHNDYGSSGDRRLSSSSEGPVYDRQERRLPLDSQRSSSRDRNGFGHDQRGRASSRIGRLIVDAARVLDRSVITVSMATGTPATEATVIGTTAPELDTTTPTTGTLVIKKPRGSPDRCFIRGNRTRSLLGCLNGKAVKRIPSFQLYQATVT